MRYHLNKEKNVFSNVDQSIDITMSQSKNPQNINFIALGAMGVKREDIVDLFAIFLDSLFKPPYDIVA